MGKQVQIDSDSPRMGNRTTPSVLVDCQDLKVCLCRKLSVGSTSGIKIESRKNHSRPNPLFTSPEDLALLTAVPLTETTEKRGLLRADG